MFLFFVSFSFVSRDIFINFDSFSIEMYGFMGLCVYIDPVHGLTKMGSDLALGILGPRNIL